ncbi:hypothetical protein COO60DRAFT_1647296 [Scenedesmus sp. NREL 46B-D3]|nr:hypothetical protein COO60DRAFT_1647296 [Scenedesmus sp. NREL 46B-D3]
MAGAAASQQLGEQLLQVGPHSLLLHQRPKESGNTAHLQRAAEKQLDQQQAQAQHLNLEQPAGAAGGTAATEQQLQQPDLSRVGLVLWQSGYVLSDFLLLRLPQLQAGRHSCSSSWAGARVLELGCGAGTVGMFLALAGAQVVLTDLPHILPLTQENLELNFPLTSKAGVSSSNSSSSRAAAEAQPAGRQQPAALPGWQVFAAGPLVVEHSWGEPAERLQQRVAAAAAARLPGAASCTAMRQLQQEQEPQQQRQQEDAQEQGSLRLAGPSRAFDFVVGADLLYDPAYHQALLTSLQQLCAPHTQVFLCYRCRGLGEQAFQAAATGAGWAVEAVPCHLLHPEYQGGDYHLLRLVKTG